MRPRPRGPVPPQGCGPHARRAQAGRNTGPRHLPVQVSAAPAAPEQPPAISTVFWPGFVPSRHQPAHRPSAALQAAPPPVLRAALGPRSRSPPTRAAAARHLRRGHGAAARRPRSSLPRGARPRGGTPGPRDAPRPCAGRRKMAAGQNGAPRHPIPHPAHRMASSSWSR